MSESLFLTSEDFCAVVDGRGCRVQSVRVHDSLCPFQWQFGSLKDMVEVEWESVERQKKMMHHKHFRLSGQRRVFRGKFSQLLDLMLLQYIVLQVLHVLFVLLWDRSIQFIAFLLHIAMDFNYGAHSKLRG